jgi:thiamine-monophosphate kinase
VHAAIDVSDGLLLDLHTLLQASGGLGAEIDAGALPIRRAARRLAGGDPFCALQHALGDGEDHVLLWTQAAGVLPAGGPLSARARRPIGRVLGKPGLWLVHEDRRERVQPLGFRHELGARDDDPAG